MAAIHSLLNPAPELEKTSESEPDPPRASHQSPHSTPSHQARKKQKICKDAAVFVPGSIRGECRYPPHEYQDDMLAAQHQQFEIYPMGQIADFPRHIPYNSEKKFFYEKTGRESLEVFQYNFKVPGDDTQYAMLWDYNIGLVRTTPLFKCTGHSKTTPAKMLNRNHGLRDICHSITGGALVAQGYWMPYDAAKAIAATFCWTIRYALTPVFGTDFPATCIPPTADGFGNMTIDAAITRRCTEQARTYRDLEPQIPTSRPPSTVPTPLTPDTPTYPHRTKHFRPKPLKLPTTTYASDTDDSYALSSTTPEPPSHSLWTPANTPRSMPQNYTLTRKTLDQQVPSSPELSPKSHRVRAVDNDDAYDGDSSEDSSISETTRKVSLAGLPSDEKAAYLLMSLRVLGGPGVAGDVGEVRGKKRRAST